MIMLFFLFCLVCTIEVLYSPRLGRNTETNEWLVWYNTPDGRDWFKIF